MEFAAAGQLESWGFPEVVGSGKTHSCDKSPCQRAGEETRTPNLLFTRQLRYRLRHASDAGTAYPSVAVRRAPGPPTNAVPRPVTTTSSPAPKSAAPPRTRSSFAVGELAVTSPSATSRMRPPVDAGTGTASPPASMRHSSNSGAGVG